MTEKYFRLYFNLPLGISGQNIEGSHDWILWRSNEYLMHSVFLGGPHDSPRKLHTVSFGSGGSGAETRTNKGIYFDLH